MTAYYALDLLVGFGGPAALFLLCRAGALPRPLWPLFWYGAALGLVWEVPIFALSVTGQVQVIEWITELPVHPAVFVVCHSLWDGLLLVSGLWLARFFSPPHVGWWRELLILIVWGQVTALLVEVSSVLSGAWTYVGGHPWNPTLFEVAGSPITAAMQVTWVVAPLVFYLVAAQISPTPISTKLSRR